MYSRLAASETIVFPSNIPLDAALSWKVSSSLLHVIAVSSSIYRLWERFSVHRAWWDDYVLFLPLVLEIFFAISFWFSIPPQGHGSDSGEKVAYSFIVLNSYWFTHFMFIIIIWSTRIVLALSLARLFPKRTRPRTCSWILVAIMTSFLLSGILISATTCQRKTILLAAGDCIRGIAGVPLEDIFLFAGDIIGDTLLVLCPIFWFWNIRLPPKERRLVLLAFCGNVLTLISAIAYILLIKLGMSKDNGTQYLFHIGMAHINAGISLFVCNFTVVTTSLYRRVRRRRPSESIPVTTTSRTSTRETSLPTDTSYPPTRTMDPESSSEKSPTPSVLTEISSFSPVHDSYTSNSVDSKISASTT